MIPFFEKYGEKLIEGKGKVHHKAYILTILRDIGNAGKVALSDGVFRDILTL